jgi:hypothetical protein
MGLSCHACAAAPDLPRDRRSRGGGVVKGRRKQFFFEKKNQKTFVLFVDAPSINDAYRNE